MIPLRQIVNLMVDMPFRSINLIGEILRIPLKKNLKNELV